MKKIVFLLMAVLSILSVMGCGSKGQLTAQELKEKYSLTATAEENKIIVDADITYLNDDVLCLFEFLQADAAGFVDLLGITTVGGNSLAAPATYDTLSLLDKVGRSDVGVYIGNDVPINGFWDVDEMRATIGKMDFIGGYAYLDRYIAPQDYMESTDLATTQFDPPQSRAQEQSAVDFMIEQVHRYPGKVTIMALGSCINVAEAVEKDPEFASLAAGIIYMGGVFEVPGEELPNIEVNWWYDADSVDISLHADWKSQIIVPHDAAVNCLKGEDVYQRYKENNRTIYTQILVDELGPIYESGETEALLYSWDPIVGAIFLCPDLIMEAETREVTIDTDRELSYGRCCAYDIGKGAEGAVECEIIFAVDRDRLWDFIADIYSME